jgi:hypothetical protein
VCICLAVAGIRWFIATPQDLSHSPPPHDWHHRTSHQAQSDLRRGAEHAGPATRKRPRPRRHAASSCYVTRTNLYLHLSSCS